jgi:hypothetical protein
MAQDNLKLARRYYDAFQPRDRDAGLALTDPAVEIESRLVVMEGGYQGTKGFVGGGTTSAEPSPTTRSKSKICATSET